MPKFGAILQRYASLDAVSGAQFTGCFKIALLTRAQRPESINSGMKNGMARAASGVAACGPSRESRAARRSSQRSTGERVWVPFGSRQCPDAACADTPPAKVGPVERLRAVRPSLRLEARRARA